jgi:hypothetical protein
MVLLFFVMAHISVAFSILYVVKIEKNLAAFDSSNLESPFLLDSMAILIMTTYNNFTYNDHTNKN